MATTTQVQTVREAPEVEAFKVGLYSDALNYIKAMQGLNPDGSEILDDQGNTVCPVLPERCFLAIFSNSKEQRRVAKWWIINGSLCSSY